MIENARPRPEERRADLGSFTVTYDRLSEILCDAAQYGPTPDLEREYQRVRAWYLHAYERVQPYLLSYQEAVTPNEDEFQFLAGPPTLLDALAADEGDLIPRLLLTRSVLTRYQFHLDQLERARSPEVAVTNTRPIVVE